MGKLLVLFLFCISVNAQQGPCGIQVGPLKPDLSVKISERRFTTESFTAENCAVHEGVVSEGTHDLMRFTTTTPNTGDADLFLGAPAGCPDLYEFDECHGHFHLKDYAEYRLWTDAGYTKWVRVRNLNVPISGTPNEAYLNQAQASGEVRIGRKQAFCILDLECLSNCYRKVDGVGGWFKQSTQQFENCGTQGLTVGWQDKYSYLLDGQWVVMDGLARGKKYVLEVHVNPNWVFQEKSYLNNVDVVKFVY